MLESLARAWAAARGDVLRKVTADVLAQYGRHNAEARQVIASAFRSSRDTVVERHGPSSAWPTDLKKAISSEMRQAAHETISKARSDCLIAQLSGLQALGHSLLAVLYEAETLPGTSATLVIGEVRAWASSHQIDT